MSEPGPATRDMILSLVAGGMDLQEVAAMYPDYEPKVIERIVRAALKKAPMFYED